MEDSRHPRPAVADDVDDRRRRLREVDPQSHKWQAMKIEAKNLQSNHRTSITFESFEMNPSVKDEVFTTHSLEREQ